MLTIWHTVMTVVRTSGLGEAGRAPFLALAWVFANVALGWIGIALKHPNVGALAAGALDGAIFSAIVLGKASSRIEAGMTGFLSGFGLDSITNSGKAVSGFVHGLHEVLETIFNAATNVAMQAATGATANPVVAKPMENDGHQALEMIVMRAIWMAVGVMLVTLFVKWGQSPAAAPVAAPVTAPMPALVPFSAPTEMARSQAA